MNITIQETKKHYHINLNTPWLFERCGLADKDIAMTYFASVMHGVEALFGLSRTPQENVGTIFSGTELLAGFDLTDAAGDFQGDLTLRSCREATCFVFCGTPRLPGGGR